MLHKQSVSYTVGIVGYDAVFVIQNISVYFTSDNDKSFMDPEHLMAIIKAIGGPGDRWKQYDYYSVQYLRWVRAFVIYAVLLIDDDGEPFIHKVPLHGIRFHSPELLELFRNPWRR